MIYAIIVTCIDFLGIICIYIGNALRIYSESKSSIFLKVIGTFILIIGIIIFAGVLLFMLFYMLYVLFLTILQ